MNAESKPAKKNAPPSMLKGVAAGLLIVAALAAALFFVLGRADAPRPPQAKKPPAQGTKHEAQKTALTSF